MSPEKMRGPVSPVEAAELKTENIPDEVYEVFNTLIAQNLYGWRATVLQKDIVAELEARGLNRNEIFDKHWLDVEESYRAVGWDVMYDKPAFYAGEDYEPYFEFKTGKNG